MRKRMTIPGALAMSLYMVAALVAVVAQPEALWLVGLVCVIMYAIPHPTLGHLLCSVSLVLLVLAYTGQIQWMAEYVPCFVISPCLCISKKMLEEADGRTWQKAPEPEVLCPLERERREREDFYRMLAGSASD